MNHKTALFADLWYESWSGEHMRVRLIGPTPRPGPNGGVQYAQASLAYDLTPKEALDLATKCMTFLARSQRSNRKKAKKGKV